MRPVLKSVLACAIIAATHTALSASPDAPIIAATHTALSASPDAPAVSSSRFEAAGPNAFTANIAGRSFRFEAEGLRVTTGGSSWRYSLLAISGGVSVAAARGIPLRTQESELEYLHAQRVIERYRSATGGVEQQFVIPGPWHGGDILIEGELQTDMVPDSAVSSTGMAFRGANGEELHYGAAKAFDADGRAASLETRWQQGMLTLVVPSDFLAKARFPILVDPVIGQGYFDLDSAIDLVTLPKVAGSGSFDQGFLVAWGTDGHVAGTRKILGKLIDNQGRAAGAGVTLNIANFGGVKFEAVRLAWSPVAQNWTTVMAYDNLGGDVPKAIYVVSISPGGVILGSNIFSKSGLPAGVQQRDADIACSDQGICLITWMYDSDNDASHTLDSVAGQFVSAQTLSAIGAAFQIVQGTATRSQARIASDGLGFLVVNANETTGEIEYRTVSTGPTVTLVTGNTTGTLRKPSISFNRAYNKYLVAFTGGDTTYGRRVDNAPSPPVVDAFNTTVSSSCDLPELSSEEQSGWTVACRDLTVSPVSFALVTFNVDTTIRKHANLLTGVGAGVASASIAESIRGVSVVVSEVIYASDDHDPYFNFFRELSTESCDFDGNGFASVALFHPSTGTFYYQFDLKDAAVLPPLSVKFGAPGDIPGFARRSPPYLRQHPYVFRPSSGVWFDTWNLDGLLSAASVWGTAGDIPVPGDYNRGGITQRAVFRPSNGVWYVQGGAAAKFGTTGDIPVPGDYNGDWITDWAVFRPSSGTWYLNFNQNGNVDLGVFFGTAGDIPVPADYDGNGTTDIAVFRPSTGYWWIDLNKDGIPDIAVKFGQAGDIPFAASVSGLGQNLMNIGVFRPSTGMWYISTKLDGVADIVLQFGASGDIILLQPVGQSNF